MFKYFFWELNIIYYLANCKIENAALAWFLQLKAQ